MVNEVAAAPKKFIISKETLDAILNFVNFAAKYREIPGAMAQEITKALGTPGSFMPFIEKAKEQNPNKLPKPPKPSKKGD